MCCLPPPKSKFALWVHLLVLLELLVLRVAGVNNTEVLRGKACTRVKTYATSFLTDAQCASFLDLVSAGFYDGKDAPTIQNEVLNSLSTMLTGTQLMQGLQVYNQLTKDLGGSDAMNKVIGTLTTVLTNNGTPFLNQCKTRLATMKTRGKGRFACINQMYRMCLQFMTFKRIKTIFSRVKNNLDATTFSTAQKDLGTLINFGLYGL